MSTSIGPTRMDGGRWVIDQQTTLLYCFMINYLHGSWVKKARTEQSQSQMIDLNIKWAKCRLYGMMNTLVARCWAKFQCSITTHLSRPLPKRKWKEVVFTVGNWPHVHKLPIVFLVQTLTIEMLESDLNFSECQNNHFQHLTWDNNDIW